MMELASRVIGGVTVILTVTISLMKMTAVEEFYHSKVYTYYVYPELKCLPVEFRCKDKRECVQRRYALF